jgi:hypothetical protein
MSDACVTDPFAGQKESFHGLDTFAILVKGASSRGIDPSRIFAKQIMLVKLYQMLTALTVGRPVLTHAQHC